MYNPVVPEFLRTRLDCIDYLEITSDMFWTDHGIGRTPRFQELESWVEMLEWVAPDRPLVAHNVGLSIGTAGLFDVEYVDHMSEWTHRYGFAWQSDHLSFGQLPGTNGRRGTGLALPLPFDHEVLEMVAERVAEVRAAVPGRFLLENGVTYVQLPEQEMTEPQFLNALTGHGTCGLLLDLHNLYVNARNHDFDAFAFLAELDLSSVVEVHIAGGNELAGMYTDAHSGPSPEAVWQLLESVVPRAPNLCGITFEFHDSYYGLLGIDGIASELHRARGVWDRFRAPQP